MQLLLLHCARATCCCVVPMQLVACCALHDASTAMSLTRPSHHRHAHASLEEITPIIRSLRLNYDKGAIKDGSREFHPGADPMTLWASWLKEAIEGQACAEPSAVALATADEKGWPSVRFMLLKGSDERGFHFFTNYDSWVTRVHGRGRCLEHIVGHSAS
jgi:hypothetical protein